MQRLQRLVRQRGVGIGLIALLLLSTAGTAAFSWPWSKAAADTYRTQAVTRANVATTIATSGPLSATTSLNLSFPSAGTLKQVYVKQGDHVQAGQALAQLD